MGTAIRRRVRALATPAGVLLACAIAMPQALTRSSERAAAAVAPGPQPATAVAAAIGRGRPAGSARLFRTVSWKVRYKLALVAAARRLPPPVVRRVIAAANRIARAPYGYGGGHGAWEAGAYDCSGSVSYALHGGGLLDAALDSSGLMSWGEPGRGRWITVYANPGHAFMVVAGRRFDTTGRDETGSRWQPAMRDASGYAVRHPAGL